MKFSNDTCLANRGDDSRCHSALHGIPEGELLSANTAQEVAAPETLDAAFSKDIGMTIKPSRKLVPTAYNKARQFAHFVYWTLARSRRCAMR